MPAEIGGAALDFPVHAVLQPLFLYLLDGEDVPGPGHSSLTLLHLFLYFFSRRLS